ncbi:Predicted amidohydrolase [Pseudosulfitobacter pseudonitzschiae]|uniref:Amidohydrolase n=1 Tax=Pseudosulfitobacter pseudonitzschiae TaxID=1402135 RepID=A0A073J4T1_9RHOB|nr:carbon-nitrogen hydrolase family protein [Pseudosulfitobacter pseudonitzschiae]KEJ96974.1 amidohydrolase [Pseudosulfitobacter pseudonitzschiae]QKS07106.1 carbon-nitrogen hydrolase family protein [Pseudosulfitobacter pseudonitzschiae]SHF48139.1 Predicted amidohydrolase [Pseudosulfitobacter pseudonitzschiae]
MKAALLQLNVGDDPAANLVQTSALLGAAVDAGAQFVLSPEVTNCISTRRDRQQEVLQDEASDITLAGLRAQAAARGIWLLIGSLAVKTDDADGRFANRQFLIGPDGDIRARYDKIHMFDVQIGEGETYRESAGYRPGTRAVVADMPGFRLGMATCYDMRFGHLSRALVQAGAQVLVYPSAFSPVTGAAHWHSLLRARAIESGAWVLAPAQTGTHPATSGSQRSTYGHSLVVDPWGDVVVDAGAEPGFSVFDLDISKVTDARRRIPALENAREFDGP